ncbi:hypothetical protein N9E31_00895 [Paracoccaceae bacterium]|nr:hypothetical protein [Paracoccaceae bacterium]
MKIIIITIMVSLLTTTMGCNSSKYNEIVAPRYCNEAAFYAGTEDRGSPFPYEREYRKVNRQLQTAKLTIEKCLEVINEQEKKSYTQGGYEQRRTKLEDLQNRHITYFEPFIDEIAPEDSKPKESVKTQKALAKPVNMENETASWLERIGKLPSIASVDIHSTALVVFPTTDFPVSNYNRLANMLCVNAEKQGFNVVRFMDSKEFLFKGKYKVFKRYKC